MGNKTCCSSATPSAIAFANYDIAAEVYTTHDIKNSESKSYLENESSSADKLEKCSVTDILPQSKDSCSKNISPKAQKKTDLDNRSNEQTEEILKEIEKTITDTSKIVILEGELLRYRAGEKTRFIPRWFRCSRTHLLIYRNRISAASEEKPLMSICLNTIQQILSVNIPNNSSFLTFELLTSSKDDTNGFNPISFSPLLSSASPSESARSHFSVSKSSQQVNLILKKSSNRDVSLFHKPTIFQSASMLTIKPANYKSSDFSNLKNGSSWSCREALMYEAGIFYIDQRYIFGTSIQMDYIKWMCGLNMIIKLMNKRV